MPILILSGGLMVPAPQVSDMPHTSVSGTPIAMEELEHLGRRGRGRRPLIRRDLVEADGRKQFVEDEFLGLRVLGQQRFIGAIAFAAEAQPDRPGPFAVRRRPPTAAPPFGWRRVRTRSAPRAPP